MCFSYADIWAGVVSEQGVLFLCRVFFNAARVLVF